MPNPKHDRSTYVHIDSIDDVLAPMPVNVRNTVTTEIAGSNGGAVPIAPADSAAIDAFARLRVSNPITLFDSQNHYDDHRIHWQTKITNTSGNASAIYNSNLAEVQMYVEASDTIIRQTRRYFRYQPGKSQLVLVTFVMDSQDSDFCQRIGYFDDRNGVFLEDDNGTYSLVTRSYTSGSTVDTAIPQASWNIDSFDGTGPSGYTIDFTKAQILLIDLEWLGVGRVRTGFVIDGIPYYAHEFYHANIVDSVYMTTANLPIRYEMSGGAGAVGGKTLQAICSSVMAEGGFQIASGLQFAASNGITVREITNASYVPVIAIRPKLVVNNIINRGRIIPEMVSIYAQAQPLHYILYWGGSIPDGSWISIGPDSIAEYNVTGTSVSGGVQVASGYIPASQQSRGITQKENTSDYPLFLDIDGNHPVTPYTDQWIIALKALSTTTNGGASIEIRELR